MMMIIINCTVLIPIGQFWLTYVIIIIIIYYKIIITSDIKMLARFTAMPVSGVTDKFGYVL
jgi:succinate-acetate transporter protein